MHAEEVEAKLVALEAGIARVDAAGRAALQRQDLAMDGNEVMERLGRGPGRHVGRALAFLTDRVIESPEQNTPERLRALLDAWTDENQQEGGSE